MKTVKVADAHHRFIEEFKDNWESVRVFDSWLTATSHGSDMTANKPTEKQD